MLPPALATAILTRIIKDGGSTYDILEARAVEKAIPLHTFEAAMTIVHRSKLIEQSVKSGVIQYKVAVKKTPVIHTGAAWVTHNYPKMDSTNDSSGIDVDFSYLFLTPEEMDRYRAEVRGVAFISKKRYAKTH